MKSAIRVAHQGSDQSGTQNSTQNSAQNHAQNSDQDSDQSSTRGNDNRGARLRHARHGYAWEQRIAG